ncbi:hypothetical protein [Hydrotalea sp.]|uniref:hypothetical protein n=1 Tax=Hydrotalea sp. TaxID=2881279 RepID=UPI00260725E7|nr:hypothetical protein [Hydrotalea sp.]
MKSILALSTFVILCSFTTPTTPITKIQFHSEKQYVCTVSLECGGVTVTATGSTCAEAGQKAGGACDKILAPVAGL